LFAVVSGIEPWTWWFAAVPSEKVVPEGSEVPAPPFSVIFRLKLSSKMVVPFRTTANSSTLTTVAAASSE
jgi:hypothetical protein